jgi:(1->4)-alpha-D-glucan 1-alpha-D-glucosylmutase
MKPKLTATYRIQLQPDFGFDQAGEVISYLRDLGISHLYCSPYLQSASGSVHGYDVVDPTQVNQELGGQEAYLRMNRTLTSEGLGQVADIVPNHMAILGDQNPWWWDVLENGPSSRYATTFDVDWDASEERWPNKVLLPVLGDHYGRILESGGLKLVFDEEKFVIQYDEQIFPVDPRSLSSLLGNAAESCGSEMLAFLAESHGRLPRPSVTLRKPVDSVHRDKSVLAKLLVRLCDEEPDTASAIYEEVARINQDPDALDFIIDEQNYRLAYWRMASRALGYRRFFDIKELAGLRAEDEVVFKKTHELPITWVRNGWVQGLRIDHPDGLRDPAKYFIQLREACPDAWIVAEKILEPGETLPEGWPIDGTTGYDFLNLTNNLFIDPRGEQNMTDNYRDFTDVRIDYLTLSYNCKRLVLSEILVSELNRLSGLFVEICEKHRRHRDYTKHELFEVLCETAVFFPVYRSYVSADDNIVSEDDERWIVKAIENAKAERPDIDPELFGFFKNILLLRFTGSLEGELVMRFQQLTGPAMAKGVEDTALYRYHRLTSLNEVGGNPSTFGISLQQFHEACMYGFSNYPLSMLTSTTHDTKRSEDVRARLSILSEIPEQWMQAVLKWSGHNTKYRSGRVPDRNTEYLLYQTLVGTWPISRERVTVYMEKAVREAKEHTSWTDQNESYEHDLKQFISAVMGDPIFQEMLEDFVAEIITPGRINSLSQTLIKLCAPGIPDIYQGSELWNLSLVDPDNRTPVDFRLRKELLSELDQLSPETIMERLDEGLPKLWLIRQVLQFRRIHPEILNESSEYVPVYAHGSKSDHLAAFMRGGKALILVPRFVMKLNGDWDDTTVVLPESSWHNILTGEKMAGGAVGIEELLSRFPVGMLIREGS